MITLALPDRLAKSYQFHFSVALVLMIAAFVINGNLVARPPILSYVIDRSLAAQEIYSILAFVGLYFCVLGLFVMVFGSGYFFEDHPIFRVIWILFCVYTVVWPSEASPGIVHVAAIASALVAASMWLEDPLPTIRTLATVTFFGLAIFFASVGVMWFFGFYLLAEQIREFIGFDKLNAQSPIAIATMLGLAYTIFFVQLFVRKALSDGPFDPTAA